MLSPFSLLLPLFDPMFACIFEVMFVAAFQHLIFADKSNDMAVRVAQMKRSNGINNIYLIANEHVKEYFEISGFGG